MATTETARPRVLLDSKEAMRKLKLLEEQADKLKYAIKETGKNNDLSGQKKLRSQLRKTNKEIKDLRTKGVDVQKTLNNLSGASMRDLQNAARKTKKEMDGLNRESAEFKAKSKQYNAIKNEIRGVGKEAKKTGSRFSRAADAFNKYSMGIMAGVAAVTGFVMIMREAADVANKFESAVGNLQALTGLAGTELQWLADKAKETSVATVEGGVKIKQSAEDIVQAYKLVGSQRPDLLKNKEALHGVTQDAIILSEAATMELGPAAKAMAGALNQFNMESSESRRVINALAAGSQAGAADIQYLASAIEKSGTTAKLMGLNIEETIGVIEGIAPKFTDASQAGNSFDKVLLKMKTQQIGYTDGVFNMNDAINELRDRFQKGESAVSIFGERHAKLAEILVMGQDDVNHYTETVKGTNKAIEQATINTSDNEAALKQAQNRFKLVAMEVGEKFAPALIFSTNAARKVIEAVFTLIEVFKKYGDLILGATIAIVGYYTAVKIQTLWEKRALITKKAIALAESKNLILRNAGAVALRVKILLTKRSTTAEKSALATTKKLNKAMKANPIGIMVAAFAAAIPLAIRFSKLLDGIEISVKELNETTKESAKDVGFKRMLDRYEELKNKTNRTKEEQKEFNDLLKELAKVAPEAGIKLDEYGNVVEEAGNKIEKGTQRIIDGNIKVYQAKLKEAKNTLETYQEDIAEMQKQLETGMSGTGATAVSIPGSILIKIEEKLNKTIEKAAKYKKDIKELEYDIALLTESVIDPFDKFSNILGDITAESTKELENLKKELQKAINFAPEDDQFIEAVKQQIERVNAELKKIGTTDADSDYFDMKTFKKMLEDAKKEYAEYEKVKTYLTKEQTEERYGEQLKQGQSYQAFLRKQADKYKDHTGALIEIYKEFESKKADIGKSWAERMQDFRKKWGLLTNQELFEIERDGILQRKEYYLLTEKEKLKIAKKLNEKYQREIKKIGVNDDDKDLSDLIPSEEETESPDADMPELSYEDQKYAESLQGRKELLEQYHNDNIISHKEYVDKMNNIDKEELNNYQQKLQQQAQNASTLFSEYMGYRQSQLDNQLKHELASHRGNEKKQEQIKAEYAKKQQKLRLQEAKMNMAAGMVNAMTMSPWPLAMAAMTLVALKGAEQIAQIRSMEYEKGGYTKGASNDKEPAGVVHSNEFVANAQAVRNPTVKPYLDEIDLAQKNGSITTIDFHNVAAAMNQRKAFQSGGYTPTQREPDNQQPIADTQQPIAILDDKSIQLLARTLAQTERKIIFTPESIKKFTEAQDEIINIEYQ